MKKLTSAVLLIVFASALIALVLWSLGDESPKDNGRVSKKAPAKKKIELNESDVPAPDIKKEVTPKKVAPKKEKKAPSKKEDKAPLTKVIFKTYLHDGSDFRMPVHVKWNGKNYGGPGVYGFDTEFQLPPGTGSAYCKIYRQFGDIGSGQSDPVTFSINGEKEKVIKLTLRDSPGYGIEISHENPEETRPLFSGLVYDQSGTMSEAQIKEKVQLSPIGSSTSYVVLDVSPGLYHVAVSSAPFRVDVIQSLLVTNTLAKINVKVPNLESLDSWRTVKVVNSEGLAIEGARFVVNHLYNQEFTSPKAIQFKPKTKYMGQGLYKVQIHQSNRSTQQPDSNYLATYQRRTLLAKTPFQLKQKAISVLVKKRAEIDFAITLKTRPEQRIMIEMTGPSKVGFIEYSKKKSVTGLIPGKYEVRITLELRHSYRPIRNRRPRICVFEETIELKSGKNELKTFVENYDWSLNLGEAKTALRISRTKDGRTRHWFSRSDEKGLVNFDNLLPGTYKVKVWSGTPFPSFSVP